MKQAYQLEQDDELQNFKNNPIDKVAEIVKGNYPMLHIAGDMDDVVPVEENTAVFERKVKELGGDITVIHKSDVGHHPHSLENPQTIVDFILKATDKQDLN